jgi:hypothetical protein
LPSRLLYAVRWMPAHPAYSPFPKRPIASPDRRRFPDLNAVGIVQSEPISVAVSPGAGSSGTALLEPRLPGAAPPGSVTTPPARACMKGSRWRRLGGTDGTAGRSPTDQGQNWAEPARSTNRQLRHQARPAVSSAATGRAGTRPGPCLSVFCSKSGQGLRTSQRRRRRPRLRHTVSRVSSR